MIDSDRRYLVISAGQDARRGTRTVAWRWTATYQSPVPLGSPVRPLPLASLAAWPAAADAKLEVRCVGMVE